MTTLHESRKLRSFADFQVDLLKGELRKHGRRLHLQEKPFQILCLLIARAGEVVTREELRERLWPADTYVDFDANLNTSLNRLRHALGDKASEQTLIKTIPRQGYRFIAPVTLLDAKEEGPVGVDKALANSSLEEFAPAEEHSTPILQRRGAILACGMFFIIVISLLGYLGWKRHLANAAPTPHRVTILVTPLLELDGDKQRDSLGESLTDEIITRLGRVSPVRLSVIARSTAMQYVDAHKTVAQMAREQHADYILEGGYRRQGDRVRITAQLFDARDQSSVWSEVYERDTADLFTVERDVTGRIAQSVSERLLGSPESRPVSSSP